jgi:hypothetical protein
MHDGHFGMTGDNSEKSGSHHFALIMWASEKKNPTTFAMDHPALRRWISRHISTVTSNGRPGIQELNCNALQQNLDKRGQPLAGAALGANKLEFILANEPWRNLP